MKEAFKPLGFGWMLIGILLTFITIIYMLVNGYKPESYYSEKYNDARLTQSVLNSFIFPVLFVFVPSIFFYLAWYWLGSFWILWEIVTFFGWFVLKGGSLPFIAIVVPVLLLGVVVFGIIAEIIKSKRKPLILELIEKQRLLRNRILIPLILVILLGGAFMFTQSISSDIAFDTAYQPRSYENLGEEKIVRSDIGESTVK